MALVTKLKWSSYIHVTIITVKSQFARESVELFIEK